MKFAALLLLCLFVGALARPDSGLHEGEIEKLRPKGLQSLMSSEAHSLESEKHNKEKRAWGGYGYGEESAGDDGCDDEGSLSSEESSYDSGSSSWSEEDTRFKRSASSSDSSSDGLASNLAGLSAPMNNLSIPTGPRIIPRKDSPGDLLNNVVQLLAQLLGLKGVKDLPDLISKLLSGILGVPLQTILKNLSSINIRDLLESNNPLRAILQQLPLVEVLTNLVDAVLSLVSNVIKIVVLLLNLVLNLVAGLLGGPDVSIEI